MTFGNVIWRLPVILLMRLSEISLQVHIYVKRSVEFFKNLTSPYNFRALLYFIQINLMILFLFQTTWCTKIAPEF
jgi:hypothetical protein